MGPPQIQVPRTVPEDFLSSYCWCNTVPFNSMPTSHDLFAEKLSGFGQFQSLSTDFSGAGIETEADRYMGSKEEVYFEQLKGYKYDTVQSFDPLKHKSVTEYRCGYHGCGKILQKPWNLLDHVRMHEGVKPFICQWCGKGFTQKGNLKKHARQHINPDVNERKRYNCKHCGKGYTERYNLKVNNQYHLSNFYRLLNFRISYFLLKYTRCLVYH